MNTTVLTPRQVMERSMVRHWDPIASKDQAKNLRHRLKLTSGFETRFTDLGHCAYCTYPTGPNSCNSVMQNVEEAGGKNAASRLALVRAAAEMGRAMPVTEEEAIATGLVKWFAEWEQIIPQDAREALRPLAGQAAAIGMAVA